MTLPHRDTAAADRLRPLERHKVPCQTASATLANARVSPLHLFVFFLTAAPGRLSALWTPRSPSPNENLKFSARNQTRCSYSRPPRALPHPVPPVQITEPTGPPRRAGPTTERGSDVSVTEAATWTRWSPAPRNPLPPTALRQQEEEQRL